MRMILVKRDWKVAFAPFTAWRMLSVRISPVENRADDLRSLARAKAARGAAPAAELESLEPAGVVPASAASRASRAVPGGFGRGRLTGDESERSELLLLSMLLLSMRWRKPSSLTRWGLLPSVCLLGPGEAERAAAGAVRGEDVRGEKRLRTLLVALPRGVSVAGASPS